jgi:hypothetical protein
MVGRLIVAEIARAFLVQETIMGWWITRAKARIKAARIPRFGAIREGSARADADRYPFIAGARRGGDLNRLFLVVRSSQLTEYKDKYPAKTAAAMRDACPAELIRPAQVRTLATKAVARVDVLESGQRGWRLPYQDR